MGLPTFVRLPRRVLQRPAGLFRRYVRLSLTFNLPRIYPTELVGQVEKGRERRPAAPITTMRQRYSRRVL
jgi:hypothetical protein